MPLDFYVQSKDTGFNDNEAIQPVVNGEDANQTIFRRPSENLRTRSEDIRKQFDLLEAVVASDRGLTIMALTDAYINWNATTGIFDVTDESGTGTRDLYIVPLLSTTEGPAGTPPGSHIPSMYVYHDTGTGSKFSIQAHATLRDHGDAGASRRSGANNLFFKFQTSAGTPAGSPAVSVEGDSAVGPTFPEDGPVTIVVTVNTAGDTVANIVSALQAAGDHDTYIDTSNVKSLVAGNCVQTKDRARFYDGATGDYALGEQSMGAIDPEGIKITNSVLSSFFSNADNRLTAEGDVLVVNFTDAEDRLNNQTDTTMDGMLQKLQRNTAMAAQRHVVPICKRFDGNLYFLNGTVFEDGSPGRLIPDPGDVTELQAAYDAHVAGTADKHADADVTAELHDGTGDPADTTLPMSLPGSSQVREHIDELCRGLNRHMDGTVTNFRHPDSDVTATLKSDSPRSLTAGDVNSQLVEMLGHYNHHVNAGDGPLDKHADGDVTAAEKAKIKFTLAAGSVNSQMDELATAVDDHIDGSNSNFKHPIKDIDNRPTVIVDSAGDGDYTDIAAAITDYADGNKGARILVKKGVYTAAYSGKIQSPIDVIGVESGAEWQVTALNMFRIQSTDTWTNPISFYNMTFRRPNGTTSTQVVVDGSFQRRAKISFKNCQFIDQNQSTTTWTQFTECKATIENCTFWSLAGAGYRTIAVKTGNDVYLTVQNCHFEDCGQIWEATLSAKTINFTGNYIDGCGYTVDGSDVGWLFDGKTYAHDLVIIRDNYMTGFTSSTNQALFVNVAPYTGSIENNYYENYESLVSAAAVDYVMHVEALDIHYPITVIGNFIIPGEFSGLEVEGGAKVIGNTIQDINPAYSNGYGIRCTGSYGALLKGNTLWGLSTAGLTIISVSADDVHVEGNTVAHGGSGAWNIHVAAGRCHIIGNNIQSGNVSYAIQIEASGVNSICASNIITNVANGILSAADDIAITGNVIRITGSGFGLSLTTTAARNAVTGNAFYDGTATGVGIKDSGILNAYSGNTFYNFERAIDLQDATNFCCSSNIMHVPDVNNSKGVDAHRSSLTAIQGAIVNNTMFRMGNTNKTGSYGIDVEYVDDCEVTGNSIWPYQYYEDPPINDTNATGIGTGKNNSAPNTDTYNSFNSAV